MNDARELWREELAPTPDCIAIERLGDELTVAEREHLSTCSRCQSEQALFQSFQDEASPDEIRDSQWIAAELQRRLAPPSNVKPFQPRFRAYRGLAAAAAAVVVFGTAYWMENREPSLDPNLGGGEVYRTSRLEAIAPIGDVSAPPTMLQWTAVPNATSYAVEVLEVDRTVLWRGETPQPNIAIPAEVVARFTPGKTLLWDVTAREGANATASSGMQRFRVALNAPGRYNS